MFFYAPLLLSIAYLIGSIPIGLILSKLAGYGDIRKIGSGNIGATNVLRTGSKSLALWTLILDAGKGALTVALYYKLMRFLVTDEYFSIAGFCNEHPNCVRLLISFGVLLGFFAIIGHCYPVWLKFKGGKGVATALGVFLAATPLAGLAACAAWLVIAFISKISSLSALVAVLTAPVVTYFIYGQEPAAITLLISALVWWRHRENIKRLLNGTEPKISFKKAE